MTKDKPEVDSLTYCIPLPCSTSYETTG